MNVRGAGFRKLAYAGARYGPRSWVKYSPALFGLAFACALPGEREKIRESLRRFRGARGPVAENVDVFRTFVEYAHCLTEALAVERPEARAAVPVVHGAEHLRAVLSAGRGAVVATAHAGAWDAAARFLARDYAADVLVVMAREEDGGARNLQDTLRAKSGVRVVHVGSHPLDALPVLKQLKRGGLVAIQLDRTRESEPAFEVLLGGSPFRVPRGPFWLAKVVGSPILPVFTRRLGLFRHQIDVLPPIFVAAEAGETEMEAAAREATRAMERFLSENPTQWFHFWH